MPIGEHVRRAAAVAGVGLAACLSGCVSLVGHDVPRSHPEPLADTFLVQTGLQIPPPRPLDAPPKNAPRIEVPWRIPGSDAGLPALPENTPENRPARLRALRELFPDITDRRPEPVVDPTPDRPGATVDELIEFARRNSPVLAQAAADVEAARGRWVQAGLYPNPTVGLQGDSIANLGSKGQLGYYFTQQIVTGGKLTLARAVAAYDHAVALVNLRRADVDLARRVRADYFAVLVAAETVRLQRAASEFSESVYLRQVAMVRAGSAAPFEAVALRANVSQARVGLVQARNRYVSAWKQLAATLNAPDLPVGPLAGAVDAPAARYAFDAIRRRMLAGHTDLAVVRHQIAQAEYAITQARRRAVPDVTYYNYFEHDNYVSSFQWGGQVGITVPVFDRNQGNVVAAKAQLMRLTREEERVRNDLDRQLADAYERYETAREQNDLYRTRVLPDLARGFRGLYERYDTTPDAVNYNDLVTAQLNITAQVTNYLAALQQQWQAAADLAAAVQVDRLDELDVQPPDGPPGSWPETAPLMGGQLLPGPRPLPEGK